IVADRVAKVVVAAATAPAATGGPAVTSTGPADADETSETKFVEIQRAGTGVRAYTGRRFGLRRPAEPERDGAQLSALFSWPLSHARSARGWTGRRPDHDRGRGARPERGPAGGAVRRRGGQAARPVASRYRPLARRCLHHQHPEMPAAGKPGSAAGRSRGLLTLSRAAAPPDQAGSRSRARPARTRALAARI